MEGGKLFRIQAYKRKTQKGGGGVPKGKEKLVVTAEGVNLSGRRRAAEAASRGEIRLQLQGNARRRHKAAAAGGGVGVPVGGAPVAAAGGVGEADENGVGMPQAGAPVAAAGNKSRKRGRGNNKNLIQEFDPHESQLQKPAGAANVTGGSGINFSSVKGADGIVYISDTNLACGDSGHDFREGYRALA